MSQRLSLTCVNPAKDPRYHVDYNKKINRLSWLVIKEASDNCNFFNIYIGMGQKIVIILLFAGTIVGIFIIIYQASQSVIEVVTLKGKWWYLCIY